MRFKTRPLLILFTITLCLQSIWLIWKIKDQWDYINAPKELNRRAFQSWLQHYFLYLQKSHRYLNRIPPIPACTLNGTLIGNLTISKDVVDFHEIAKENPNLEPGGKFSPSDCQSFNDKTAIIIPYRNRLNHLKVLLRHLHPLLQRQELDYQVFVIEQLGTELFNRAKLMNIAFLESQKLGNFNCYIFHDVDYFLENDCGIYKCRDNPFHFSEYVDKNNYTKMQYIDVHCGGVVGMRKRIFEIVNGFSNIYFGWGREDDDLSNRFRTLGIKVDVPEDMSCYSYSTMKHDRDDGNEKLNVSYYLRGTTATRIGADGLNSCVYDSPKIELHMLYTNISVNISYDDTFKSVMGKDVLQPFMEPF